MYLYIDIDIYIKYVFSVKCIFYFMLRMIVFCMGSNECINLGLCVFIMHSKLLRTYYPMGIY